MYFPCYIDIEKNIDFCTRHPFFFFEKLVRKPLKLVFKPLDENLKSLLL